VKNAECFIGCILYSEYFSGLLALSFSSFLFLACYHLSTNSISKVRYYWLFNVLLLSSISVLYLAMSCDMAWFFRVYLGYILLIGAFLVLFPRIYRVYLAKRYGIERFVELENFLRNLSGSTNSKLFILGSSLPKAFTLGRDVFVTAGIVELLSLEELKAVLAHEAFHVKQNRYPLVGNIRILTFLPGIRFEEYADSFAERVVGRKALESAMKRVAEFYTQDKK
jgi:heat shock protein HtpX